jgi:hypothetical protein
MLACTISSPSSASARILPLVISLERVTYTKRNVSLWIDDHRMSPLTTYHISDVIITYCGASLTAWYPAVISRAGLHMEKKIWLSTALKQLQELLGSVG